MNALRGIRTFQSIPAVVSVLQADRLELLHTQQDKKTNLTVAHTLAFPVSLKNTDNGAKHRNVPGQRYFGEEEIAIVDG